MTTLGIDWRSGVLRAAAALALAVAFSGGAAVAQSTTELPAPTGAASNIPIWRTIALGAYRSVDTLRDALDAAHCTVGDLAADILEQPAFTLSETAVGVDLAVLSAADMGFGANGAPLAEIYRRAVQLGLELCPAEVAPLLRLQYLRQPRGEFLRIAMEPVVTHRGGVAAFILGNGGAGLLLIGGDARPDLIVPSSVRFVFVHPAVAAARPRISVDAAPAVGPDAR